MSVMPAEVVWAALERAECSPRGSPSKATARCPAHDDHQPSLSLGVGRDDRALLHCFAGCPVADIVGALGLRIDDLFAAKERRPHAAKPRPRTIRIQPILDALHAIGIDHRYHDVGDGIHLWIADGCPACPANVRQQLWVDVVDGRVATSCLNQCEQRAVLDALGLRTTVAGLWSPSHGLTRRRTS